MKTTELLGIGSWAFRYASGCHGFQPPQSLTVREFARAAKELGFPRIQICENLHYAQKRNEELREDAAYIKSLDLAVELGMNGLTRESLLRHIELCELFDCHFLRAVVGGGGSDPDALYQRHYGVIKENLPRLEAAGVVLGIENHFDLTTDQIVRMVRELDSPYVRAIYDSTNSMGFVEHPMVTLEKMLPVAASCHLKDYVVEKVEAGYRIKGTVLGEGSFDIRRALERFRQEQPDATIILETTIPKDAAASAEAVLATEWQQICDCAGRLRALADSMDK